MTNLPIINTDLGMRSTKLKKFFSNSLLHIVLAMILCVYCAQSLPVNVIRFFLTISVCLKEILIFILPFLLFSFIAVALSAIPREGLFFVLGLLIVVFISNFMNIMISGTVGFLVLSGSHAGQITDNGINILPFFSLQLPKIISTTYALVIGIFTGLINSLWPNKYISKTIKAIHDAVLAFMKHIFVLLLPFFISGFLLKLVLEGKIAGFAAKNAAVCAKILCFLVLYLFLWLVVAASFKRSRAIEILKNIFPAMVTAFSSMSSAAALPMSLNAAEKNTGDKILADTVMPLTLNFHMVGDTIIVPTLALLVLLTFNHPLPDINNFALFGIFFILNKFAGGGVPSGTIMVTIPVLKKYLGFDDSMVAFIVALYGVVDPIATFGNVTANNLFVIIFQKIRKVVRRAFFQKKETQKL